MCVFYFKYCLIYRFHVQLNKNVVKTIPCLRHVGEVRHVFITKQMSIVFAILVLNTSNSSLIFIVLKVLIFHFFSNFILDLTIKLNYVLN